MPLDAQSFALTQLLAQASTQHLRLTLESLPVGLMEITEKGIIESIDESTALKLGLMPKQIKGQSITMLLEDGALSFLELVNNRHYGSLFQAAFRTQNGAFMVADVVLQPALQSHKFVCSVIFTTADILEEEQALCGLDDDVELHDSTIQAAIHENPLSSFDITLLLLLVALVLCFFVCF